MRVSFLGLDAMRDCMIKDIVSQYLGRDNFDYIGNELKGITEATVVALQLGPVVPWVYIHAISGISYPWSYPLFLFQISCPRVSRHWKAGMPAEFGGGEVSLFAPALWAEDDLFHSKLFEGDEAATDAYKPMLEKMTLEFSSPDIVRSAISLGERFVIDPDYDESWEADSDDELTRSPKTGEIFLNPTCKTLGRPRDR